MKLKDAIPIVAVGTIFLMIFTCIAPQAIYAGQTAVQSSTSVTNDYGGQSAVSSSITSTTKVSNAGSSGGVGTTGYSVQRHKHQHRQRGNRHHQRSSTHVRTISKANQPSTEGGGISCNCNCLKQGTCSCTHCECNL